MAAAAIFAALGAAWLVLFELALPPLVAPAQRIFLRSAGGAGLVVLATAAVYVLLRAEAAGRRLEADRRADEVHARLRQQVRRLDALHAVDRAIASSHDLPLALGTVLDHVVAELKLDAASLLLLERDGGALTVAESRGLRRRPGAQELASCLGGRAVREGVIVRAPDLATISEDPADAATAAGMVAYCALPMRAQRGIVGVLELFHHEALPEDAGWEGFAAALAGRAALAVDAARLVEDLRRSNVELALAYEQTIEGWSRALDLRDRETEGHTQRVTELTVRLARRMGILGEDLTHIRRGALLHDIGKMGVPDRILLKPDRLSEEEWTVMRQHPVYAFRLLSPVGHLRSALDIPYCHHERWDGQGYPRGLAKEEIPLAARIFAVADVWDALTSDRPYRPAWSADEALRYIEQGAGSQFDPRVVDVFRAMAAEGKLPRLARQRRRPTAIGSR
jgi:putative nucleotidyltransferase with HDIG domain